MPAGVRQLDNLADVTRLLGEVVAQEISVNAELEGLLAQRGVVEGTLISLQASTSEVGILSSLHAHRAAHLEAEAVQLHAPTSEVGSSCTLPLRQASNVCYVSP